MSWNEKEVTQSLRCAVGGREWKLYTADYKADGGTYSLYFYAISDDHAHAVIQDIRETLTYGGQLIGTKDQ